jgi:uncharacterized protein (DUF58 family)
MLSDELLRKVRLIEITTRKLVDDMMAGQYRSHFKGHGVQFSEHRVYYHGDDVRHIDWKVSARSRDLLVKKFEEERELTVFLVVDVSGSEHFGSGKKLKSEVAAEIAGMLAYAAVHTGDKVGVLLFAGDVELIIQPRKGKQHILRLIRDILVHKPKTRGTNLAKALESTHHIMKHGGVVFVISDFIAENYELQLRRLGRKHDVVAINISDQREVKVPDTGYVLFYDPETQEEKYIDTSSYAFKKWHKDFLTVHETDLKTAFKSGKIEMLSINTSENFGDAVVRFFRTRSRGRAKAAR